LSKRNELIAADWTAAAVVVAEQNDEDKKEKKPRLKDDRMNQPDGVSSLSLRIFFCLLPLC